jgi:glutaredoxin
VELLWCSCCPSTARALEELQAVVTEAGLDLEAIEVRHIETDEQAREEGFIGSPTIRINGRDLEEGMGERPALACRVYRLPDGRPSPTPDPQAVRAAVKGAVQGAE